MEIINYFVSIKNQAILSKPDFVLKICREILILNIY